MFELTQFKWIINNINDLEIIIKKINELNNSEFENIRQNAQYYVDKYLHSKNIKVQNKDIKSPETLLDNEYNILIASSAYYEEIYNEINKLEKTDVEEIKYSDSEEKYRLLIIAAIGLIFVELILKYTVFRSII